jgi:hypothetical protein
MFVFLRFSHRSPLFEMVCCTQECSPRTRTNFIEMLLVQTRTRPSNVERPRSPLVAWSLTGEPGASVEGTKHKTTRPRHPGWSKLFSPVGGLGQTALFLWGAINFFSFSFTFRFDCSGCLGYSGCSRRLPLFLAWSS